jgi:hypothetical protein
MALETQTPLQSDPSASNQQETPDWRELRQQERAERRMSRREWRSGSGGWIGGIMLISLGILFLLQNLGWFYLENWWALFILIPAFGAFGTAWTLYRSSGNRFPVAARGSLISGTLLTLLALTFLLGLDFAVIWPFFLILGGLAILATTLLPNG